MSLRPNFFRVALRFAVPFGVRFAVPFGIAVACLAPLAAAPAQADTVAAKPRLVVAMSGEPGFISALSAKLEGMRRFELLNRPNAKSALQQRQIALDGKLSVEKSKQALAIAGTDLLLDGKVENAAGGLRITSRLYDFRTGEITRDLSLLGDPGDMDTLAGQLAAFVRHNMPLRCEIKAINEDQIVLDLGSMDGMVEGSMFKVYRHRHNLKPREIGLIRVIKADPFAAAAEAESTGKGEVLEEGDIVVEQTAAYVLSQ